MSIQIMTTKTMTFAAMCALALLPAAPTLAQQVASVELTYSHGAFQPKEVHAPANHPVVFHVKNMDPKAMEFESTSLRVEKVVAAKSQGIVNVRPLSPGRYQFYDDFNQQARGSLIVQ